MSKNNNLKAYIVSTSLTFKAFDYDCKISKSTSSIWNLVATNSDGSKKYAVYCAPDLKKALSLIKLAKRALAPGMRLVVVTHEHSQEEYEHAQTDDYALVTLTKLKRFGDQMLILQSK